MRGDLLTQPFDPESFDVVTALASLHHMPFDAAVYRAIRVLRHGGTLIVLGLWTDHAATDVLRNLARSLEYTVCRRLWRPGRDGRAPTGARPNPGRKARDAVPAARA